MIADTHLPRSRDLWLGLDTGGTFTDAVLLNAEQQVVASAKSLTTHWDLSIGISGAIRNVLATLPEGSHRSDVSLVSVSTTLATNAVVENRFSPTCTLLIGFDDGMEERSGLSRERGSIVVRVGGGHDATGVESAPLEEAVIDAAVAEHGPRVEAFAVASRFSVRNPAHELRARERIRRLSGKSVTCAHELSSKLDAPRRALTAALNARLTPQIRHLVEALRHVLEEEGLDAPLMLVKGDGSLIKAGVALECPVETVLSGPAASVVGAGFLTGLQDFAVSDMGGTTTDVAVVRNGRPVISADGALIGGWRTMVEAVDVRTIGLGGDSEVLMDRETRLRVGPRKAMPLSLLAHQHPDILADLRILAAQDRLPDFPAQFAFRNPGRDAPESVQGIDRRIWNALTTTPQKASEVVGNAAGLEALRRLADAGLATIAAFTPSDAMHVLGLQSAWNIEAAELGATILGIEERNGKALRSAATAETISKRTHEHVVRESARIILETALAQDPGIETRDNRFGVLGDRLMEDTIAGTPFSRLVAGSLSLATPLIAIGAPVGPYYPAVAERLGTSLSIPKHAAVCNAVGAVAGVVSTTIDVVVNQPTFKLFRVHDPAGARDFDDADAAIGHAEQVARELALEAARHAGAADPHVVTQVSEKRAQTPGQADYLAEAVVRATATGRPLAGHGLDG